MTTTMNKQQQRRRQRSTRSSRLLSLVGAVASVATACSCSSSMQHAAGFSTTTTSSGSRSPLHHQETSSLPIVDERTINTILIDSRVQSSSSTKTNKKQYNKKTDGDSDNDDDDFIVIRRTQQGGKNVDAADVDGKDATNADSNSELGDLPPVLQQITDERKNFQMNLGKAMDTLRKDYPEILKQTPDFSIYHPDITVVDPSGVQLTGIDSYKSSIKFMQQFVKFWFQMDRSGLQFRLVYDFARSSIRVSWHAVLIPKVPLGKPLHLDGICMYKLDVESGKVVEHKFEKLSINNTPVVPPYGVFSLLQQQDLMGVPAGVPMGI
mmetsp:Transcript_32818/g.79779  ORF Transcript_32818/g.79779 Transcript_32818/m.79779 type:complete len:323 (+) Transcript_32818:238-1206(+)